MDINDLLMKVVEQKASDLYLSVGVQACAKVNGELVAVSDEKLTPQLILKMVYIGDLIF